MTQDDLLYVENKCSEKASALFDKHPLVQPSETQCLQLTPKSPSREKMKKIASQRYENLSFKKQKKEWTINTITLDAIMASTDDSSRVFIFSDNWYEDIPIDMKTQVAAKYLAVLVRPYGFIQTYQSDIVNSFHIHLETDASQGDKLLWVVCPNGDKLPIKKENKRKVHLAHAGAMLFSLIGASSMKALQDVAINILMRSRMKSHLEDKAQFVLECMEDLASKCYCASCRAKTASLSGSVSCKLIGCEFFKRMAKTTDVEDRFKIGLMFFEYLQTIAKVDTSMYKAYEQNYLHHLGFNNYIITQVNHLKKIIPSHVLICDHHTPIRHGEQEMLDNWPYYKEIYHREQIELGEKEELEEILAKDKHFVVYLNHQLIDNHFSNHEPIPYTWQALVLRRKDQLEWFGYILHGLTRIDKLLRKLFGLSTSTEPEELDFVKYHQLFDQQSPSAQAYITNHVQIPILEWHGNIRLLTHAHIDCMNQVFTMTDAGTFGLGLDEGELAHNMLSLDHKYKVLLDSCPYDYIAAIVFFKRILDQEDDTTKND